MLYDARVDRAGAARAQQLLHSRVARVVGRVLRIAAVCVLVLAVASATLLELVLTLLVKVGTGVYTGEDSDHAMWLALMPWTIGLWVVVVSLVVRQVHRHRTGRT